MDSPAPLSSRSGRVRRTARLATRSYRVKTGDFLVEGPHAVREALAVPGCVREIFITPEIHERHPELGAAAEKMDEQAGQVSPAAITWNVVDTDVIETISSAVHPQGVVARARQISSELSSLDGHIPDLSVIAVDVRDPGNVGSLVRVADAAGADAVILAGDCVDIHNPKAVRGSVGSVFHVPVIVETDRTAVLRALAGVQILATGASGQTSLFDDDLDLRQPTAWLLGNETHGLDAVQIDAVDAVVRIPIFGRAESLNMATAAAVCLYTTAYQRH